MGEGSYDTAATGLEGSWLYDWNPWPNRRSSPIKGGGKKTFKSEKKQENVDYWKCIKQKKNTRPCNKKRSKALKRLEKKYPKEWSQYQKEFMTNLKLRY